MASDSTDSGDSLERLMIALLVGAVLFVIAAAGVALALI